MKNNLSPDQSGEAPQPLPGFENITRYWDKTQNLYAAKIQPGEYYVTRHPNEMIVTVLGSCVSACIRDSRLKIGGMNHFMLPMKKLAKGVELEGNAERYGTYAMEALINQILSRGGLRKNLEVKVTGGGKVLAMRSDVGEKNIEFVKHFIEEERLRLLAEDLGDVYPRKVYYLPATGRLRVRKLRNVANETIATRESAYAEDLIQKPNDGEVELF